MPTTAAFPYKRHRLTVSDYHRMAEAGILSAQDRVELIEGELFDMPPIGSLHAGTVKFLSNLFRLTVGERAIVSTQDPVFLSQFSEPQPDVALLKARADFYRRSHPTAEDILLIIEVADTTVHFDREFKIPLYAQHGISEAWVVDLYNRLLHIYREPAAGGYLAVQSLAEPRTLAPVMLPECLFDLSELF